MKARERGTLSKCVLPVYLGPMHEPMGEGVTEMLHCQHSHEAVGVSVCVSVYVVVHASVCVTVFVFVC